MPIVLVLAFRRQKDKAWVLGSKPSLCCQAVSLVSVPILENFTWDFSTKQNYWARQLNELGKSIILVKCNAFLGGLGGVMTRYF